MSRESRLIAGLLLVILPTVMLGGVSILTLLIGTPEYMANKLRQDLWRAGHAHAGVFLILALIALRYVDEAALSDGETLCALRHPVRRDHPASRVLLFRPDARRHEAERDDQPGLRRRCGVGARRGDAGIGLIRRPA